MAIGDKKPVVMESDLAAPGGVATLGKDGKLAADQRPDGVALVDDADQKTRFKLGVENGQLYIQSVQE